MEHILIFYGVQLLASGYAVWRGGAPERIVALAMVAAAVATSLVPINPNHSFRSIVVGDVLVDVVFFLIMTAVALRADRFWPLWVTALQAIAIGVHGVRAYDPTVLPLAYSLLVGQIAYPMIVLLLLGTFRHRRRTRGGRLEPGWS